ncbi:MAG: CDP-alcohol phosphatidyltransferase family protein [Gammaproteobacteria bacterium]|nr:CDP-alcohol phosphatidyltransferase family protein [Gammaproteobacteria bacterium]
MTILTVSRFIKNISKELPIANVVTLIRVIMALLVLLIVQINPLTNLIAIFLILILMSLDALDGFIARSLNASSLNGSIYDILADRIIENIFFIYFASNNLFSVWFALTLLIRGLIIDAVRTIYATTKTTPFSWHKITWAKFFVNSRLSRGTYNSFKMITFICYAGLLMPQGYLFTLITHENMNHLAHLFLWLTVSMAILRTIPVIWEGLTRKRI